MPPRIDTLARKYAAELTPDELAALTAQVQAHAARLRAVNECPTALDLAARYDHGIVRTDALRLVAARLGATVAARGGRLVVSLPPQEGKSSLLEWLCVWLLADDPARRIVYASYAHGLARRAGRNVRNYLTTHGDDLGLALSREHADASDWSLDGHTGGMFTTGVGGGLTGRPADVMIVDDPIKGQAEADSEVVRGNLHDWWSSVARTRLAPGAPVIVVQCMTGDTPVLMAHGQEKPLRDVRPGDTVATYDDGSVTTSTVRNWANNGPDAIYSIRMKSGRVVRANARHPFLTVEGGELAWRRTDTLARGSVILTVTGGSGAESPALPTDATSQSAARACASRTTTGTGGPADTAVGAPRSSGPPTSSTGTGSPPPSTTPWSSSRAVAALSAASTPPSGTPARTGTGSSASITTTTPAASGDSCATTATSSPGMGSPRRFSAPPLNTWRTEPDEVVEVVPCGVEDVFDLQIDRTENFIANGLVSHNTRWHEDDLAGRRIDDGWPAINIPAVADPSTVDSLGREPGEWLASARGRTPEEWAEIRAEVGERTWAALYQGRPSPPEGGIFRQAWFDQHRVTEAPELARVEVGVDPADTGTGDAAGVLVAGRAPDGHLYVLDDLSDALSRGAWARLVCLAAVRHDAACIVSERTLGMQTAVGEAWALIRRQATALRKADGVVDLALVALASAGDDVARDRAQLAGLVPLVDDVLDRPSTGPCRVDVVTPRQSKQTRAEAITVYYETGRAHHVGRLGPLEHEAVTWQPGQPSPNRLDTLAHLLPHLDASSSPARTSRPRRRTPTRTFGAPGGSARLAAR